MANQAPATRSKEANSMVPARKETSGPAPGANEKMVVATGVEPVFIQPSRPEVAVAPAPARKPASAPAPVVEDALFMETAAEPVFIQPSRTQAAVAPAPAPVKMVPDSMTPQPWHRLNSFSSLTDVITAINQAKTRSGDEGGKLSWSRADLDPVIAVPSFDSLKTAVFGDNNTTFDADTLLKAAIDELPATAVFNNVQAQIKLTLQLEGLWLQFPAKAIKAKPSLGIAVSIGLPSSSAFDPFSSNRVYLTFGDFT
jgi:hypothetical protein